MLFSINKQNHSWSYRSLPLIPSFENLLLSMKARQEDNRRVCANCYNQNFLEYVYVDDLGELIKPGYIPVISQFFWRDMV